MGTKLRDALVWFQVSLGQRLLGNRSGPAILLYPPNHDQKIRFEELSLVKYKLFLPTQDANV